jgi:hypothetical protein
MQINDKFGHRICKAYLIKLNLFNLGAHLIVLTFILDLLGVTIERLHVLFGFSETYLKIILSQ